MDENIVNQPLIEITVFQCPLCLKIVRNRWTKIPYLCPVCGEAQLVIQCMEYEEVDHAHFIKPEAL